MADKENRFMRFENSVSIYRSKTAMIIGVLYFSKGYQSTPVIGMQFATVNDPEAKEKTFGWDADEKSWYFPTYDKCFELFNKLSRWRLQITKLREAQVKDNKEIQEKYKDVADKHKISNPIKKKTIFMRPSYYEGSYFLQVTLNLGKDNYITVAITDDELDMILKYVSTFIDQYHQLSLLHRQIVIARGQNNDSAGGSRSSYGGSKNGYHKSMGNSASNDNILSGTAPFNGVDKKDSAIDSLLQGSSIDDIMNGISSSDEDIPF